MLNNVNKVTFHAKNHIKSQNYHQKNIPPSPDIH